MSRQVDTQLLQQWAGCQHIAASLQVLSLGVAALDYELTFRLTSNGNECEEKSSVTQFGRWLCLFFTLAAAVFVLRRHSLQSELLEGQFRGRMTQRARAIVHFQQRHCRLWLGAELLCLAFFPYPVLSNYSVQIYQRNMYTTEVDFPDEEICYRLGELLYLCMLPRLIFILRALLNYSNFASPTAAWVCAGCKVAFSTKFKVKALARRYPVSFVMSIFGLVCVVFTVILRVLERPYNYTSGIDFSPITNQLWFCASTLDTAPYGDYYPQTQMGRIAAFFQCVLALALVSIVKPLMSDSVDLSKGETRAYEAIKTRRLAAKAISARVSYYLTSKKQPQDHVRRSIAHNSSVRASFNFAQQAPWLCDKAGVSDKKANKKPKLYQLEDLDGLLWRLRGKTAASLVRLESKLKYVQGQLRKLDSYAAK
jgi:hypothetical protein